MRRGHCGQSQLTYYLPLLMTLIRPITAFLALSLIARCGAPVAAAAKGAPPADAAAASLLAEIKKTFPVHGKPIPPEIFRDFGDGDLADSAGGICVTVDVEAATGSNLYTDEIKAANGYYAQKKTGSNEETGYRYIGSTDNGLLVVIADLSGGASGDFYTLHILDLVAVRAFDDEGKIDRRILLTNLRSIALGDRWDRGVTVANNSIRIVTRRNGPAGEKARGPVTIEAKRP